jgi:hypothetical protein
LEMDKSGKVTVKHEGTKGDAPLLIIAAEE